MASKLKSGIALLLVVLVVCAVGWLSLVALRFVGGTLAGVDTNIVVAVLAAASTIFASPIAVMLGRYFERKRDIEAHFRADKIKICDQFLTELFNQFGANKSKSEKELVRFLREWQRRLILWGGSQVLRTYFLWMNHIKAGKIDGQSILLMDDFFRALRAGIGHNTRGLPRGAFANLILRHADLFIEEATKNPSIPLEQLAALEEQRFGKAAM